MHERTLGELRRGFVYEFKLKNLAQRKAAADTDRESAEFYPAEGYYTLRRIPK